MSNIEQTDMTKTTRILFLSLLCLLPTLTVQAQSREWISENIRVHSDCRNVAITLSNGDLLLYGRNGWYSDDCPDEMINVLTELHDNGEYLDDVQLTEKGSWLILYGKNGFRWNNIPSSLERQLKNCHSTGEVVQLASFNDKGDWIVITKENYVASDDNIQQWLREGCDKLGTLRTVCITEDAIVAVYSDGYKAIGTIPETLQRALTDTDLEVYRLKIAGKAWFFADKDGNIDYRM